MDRQKAFAKFRAQDSRDQTFEENKDLLKQRFTDAKAFGESANNARSRINTAKSQIEQLRVERAMAGEQVDEPSADEAVLLRTIDEQKQVYQNCTTQLRAVKSEIERIQQLLEQNKKRLQRDFEQWFLQLKEAADPRKLSGDEARALLDAAPSDGGTAVSEKWTGDATVDADIRAYYEARKALG